MKSPVHLMNQPAVLHRVTFDPSVKDEYGNPTEVVTDTDVSVAVFPILSRRGVAQGATETTDLSNPQTVTMQIFLPPGIGATGTDRLTVNGEIWELTGDAVDICDPRTNEPMYAEGAIRRVH